MSEPQTRPDGAQVWPADDVSATLTELRQQHIDDLRMIDAGKSELRIIHKLNENHVKAYRRLESQRVWQCWAALVECVAYRNGNRTVLAVAKHLSCELDAMKHERDSSRRAAKAWKGLAKKWRKRSNYSEASWAIRADLDEARDVAAEAEQQRDALAARVKELEAELAKRDALLDAGPTFTRHDSAFNGHPTVTFSPHKLEPAADECLRDTKPEPAAADVLAPRTYGRIHHLLDEVRDEAAKGLAAETNEYDVNWSHRMVVDLAQHLTEALEAVRNNQAQAVERERFIAEQRKAHQDTIDHLSREQTARIKAEFVLGESRRMYCEDITEQQRLRVETQQALNDERAAHEQTRLIVELREREFFAARAAHEQTRGLLEQERDAHQITVDVMKVTSEDREALRSELEQTTQARDWLRDEVGRISRELNASRAELEQTRRDWRDETARRDEANALAITLRAELEKLREGVRGLLRRVKGCGHTTFQRADGQYIETFQLDVERDLRALIGEGG